MNKFKVREIAPPGRWRSNFMRYYWSARECASEFRELKSTLDAIRPPGSSVVLSAEERTPEVDAQYHRRDRLSDCVVIFAAMAVEAYLNFFGVTCLGEDTFAPFERRGPEKKLTSLLRNCAGVELEGDGALRLVVRRIACRRNALVHPQAAEADSAKGLAMAEGVPFSESVDGTMDDLMSFFKLFAAAVPEARAHFTGLDPNGQA